uniref:Uncharacterized protein n=1 Tax=Scylla paramamosain TaxID=85552 RepID=D2DSW7_SCYPA|nr:hypothetical protein [Scylla paramamosain]
MCIRICLFIYQSVHVKFNLKALGENIREEKQTRIITRRKEGRHERLRNCAERGGGGGGGREDQG